ERRTHALGPAGAGLGRGKPGPTQEARRRVGLLWGRLHAGRRSGGHTPLGRLAPALAGVNPAPHRRPGGGWGCCGAGFMPADAAADTRPWAGWRRPWPG